VNALPKAQMYRVAMLLKARAELADEAAEDLGPSLELDEVGVVRRLHPQAEIGLAIENAQSEVYNLCGENLDRDLLLVGIRAIIAAIDTELAALGIEITDAVEKELSQ
jgi:hypothetical protein